MPDAEWDLIKEFHRGLDELRLEECSCCHERWLDMKIQNQMCHRCRNSEVRRSWFKPENDLDLGPTPAHLPALSEVEEMLIARAHVHVQVRQIRGQQYQYSGHTVSFMQNTQKLYTKLPLKPKELNILLLKPASGNDDDSWGIKRSFDRQFRVHRNHITLWLRHLKRHHPDYRDIEIDEEVLNSLPQDGSIHDEIATRHVPVTASNDDATGPAPDVDMDGLDDDDDVDVDGLDTSAMVPDLRPEQTEFDLLRVEVAESNVLSMPSIAAEPISELGKTCILRMVFPTLFPYGKGDICSSRTHQPSLEEWTRHALRYRESRFACHARFRYVVFNMAQRQEVRKQASWICREIEGTHRMTLSQLESLVADGQEKELVGRISRRSQHCNELDAMVWNLNCPHLFFTFSAADIQWLDLHVHMPDFPDRYAFTTDPFAGGGQSRSS